MYLVLQLLLSYAFAGSFLGLQRIDGDNCATGTSIYTMTTFEVSPNPPVKNSALSCKIVGTLSEAQTFSSLQVYVIYNGINFYQEAFPETGSYSAGDSAEIDINVFLPSIAPPGNYKVKTKLENTNGDFLMCWEYAFSL